MKQLLRYPIIVSAIGATIAIASCTRTSMPQGAGGTSNLADISLGGVSVDTLPWNATYKAKSNAEREAFLTKLGFAFEMKLKASDAKCSSAALDIVQVNTYVVPNQTVTRGCTYDITVLFGSTIDPDKPATSPGTGPKTLLKVLLAGPSGPVSYKIPDGNAKPQVALQLCPSKDSAEYFDTSICAALDPAMSNTDLNANVKIGEQNDNANTYAMIKIKSGVPPCKIQSCDLTNKSTAQDFLDHYVGPLNCSIVAYVVPNGDCKNYAVDADVDALKDAVTANKAYKSGVSAKLP